MSDAPQVTTSSDATSIGTSKPSTKTRDFEEFRRLLAGYVLIPATHYGRLRSGDHIRYENEAGEYCRGGYLWESRHDATVGMIWTVGAVYPIIRSAAHFSLTLNPVRRLWKRIDYETEVVGDSLDTLRAHIADLALFLQTKYGDEFTSFMQERETKK